MRTTIATLLLLSVGSLVAADASPDDRPGGAANIENAITSYLSQTTLPPAVTSIAGALSSAGVTGPIIIDMSPTGAESTGARQTGDRTRDSEGVAAATPAPQVLMAGAMGAVGAAVLGLV
ncbi:hypothetical protein AC579_6535 [Pseudocercospora musae]|uniref:Uncharacterized protein n=1 Tax=Pseudocercospora musae TaxID=113226 RepID=A0A139ILC5_9PEZI|nr:hypothetical protein AC579_6535 [Pseudocercospora musae]